MYDRYYEIYNIFSYPPAVMNGPIYIYVGEMIGKIFKNLFYPFQYDMPVINYPSDPIPYWNYLWAGQYSVL